MPRIQYIAKNFSPKTDAVINHANDILEEYTAQGFVLTLRQLYYQFVARGLSENTIQAYKRLGTIIKDARMAGLVDWNHLTDRTRNLKELQHFDDAEDALLKLASWYHIDLWENQKVRPEVWIEKDALVGVIQQVCQDLDVPYFSCRGYTSQSEMWNAAMRLQRWRELGYEPHIIHLGDHDPSGIDMSRDIVDRLKIFMGGVQFQRIALNMDQVRKYNPPPNPAKTTDSRGSMYIHQFGSASWELDALDPKTLIELIQKAVTTLRNDKVFKQDRARKERIRESLNTLASEWEDVDQWLQDRQ